ncbi:MAG: recombinase family protein [Clostridia bacterium]|nr:recombinase family protein [Clostridia bacterium]
MSSTGNATDYGNGIAALYVRLSRDDLGARTDSIETQKQLVLAFVQNNFPGKRTKVYEDDNISGVTFERPGIKSIEKDIDIGIVDMLVVKDLSRLGRSNAKTLLFLEYMEELGVRVVTADGRYDSVKNYEFAGIDSWFNERYVMDISRKIRSNIRQKIKSGQYIGTAPYGYKKSEDDCCRLEIESGEAEVVRRIFDLYVSGKGYKKIAEILDSECILPPNPARSAELRWNPVTVKRILSNRVYIGATVQGVSRKVSYKSKKTCRLPEDMWVVTENTHARIIDEDVYRRAAAVRESRRGCGGSVRSGVNLFGSILRCGHCGGKMFLRRQKHLPSGYICAAYAKNGANACIRNFIAEDFLIKTTAEDIYAYYETAVSHFAADNGSIGDIGLDVDGRVNIADNSFDRSINPKDLSTEEKKLKQKQEKAYSDMLDGKISEDLFYRINKIFEQKIDMLCNGEKNFFCGDNDKPAENETNSGEIYSRISALLKHISLNGTNEFCDVVASPKSENSAHFFRELLSFSVEQIEIFDNEIKVHYRFKEIFNNE